LDDEAIAKLFPEESSSSVCYVFISEVSAMYNGLYDVYTV
jgi:hypothetical protein